MGKRSAHTGNGKWKCKSEKRARKTCVLYTIHRMYRAYSALPLSRRPAFRRANRKNLLSLVLFALSLSRSVTWWRLVRARISAALCLGVLTERESENKVHRRIFADAVNEHVYFLLLLSPLPCISGERQTMLEVISTLFSIRLHSLSFSPLAGRKSTCRQALSRALSLSEISVCCALCAGTVFSFVYRNTLAALWYICLWFRTFAVDTRLVGSSVDCSNIPMLSMYFVARLLIISYFVLFIPCVVRRCVHFRKWF